MEKEYKFVKDFEGIFDENQHIHLYVFDSLENCQYLVFSGKAGMFYHLINKNAKYAQFYGEFEVCDMVQDNANQSILIVAGINTQNELKEKLDPIVKAKIEFKEKIKEDIFDIQNDYVDEIDYIKQALSGEGLTKEDNRIIGVYNGFIEELDELKKKVEDM